MATKDDKTPEEIANEKYQREEAIRLANEGGPGEATNPDITANAVRAQGSTTSDENFDNMQAPREGLNMENRDVNKTDEINQGTSD